MSTSMHARLRRALANMRLALSLVSLAGNLLQERGEVGCRSYTAESASGAAARQSASSSVTISPCWAI
jgi:hypothetical protein